MKKRVALIGLGPHAKRIYYPYLLDLVERDPNVSFELLVELKINEKNVDAFLLDKKVKPKSILLLDATDQLTPEVIDPIVSEALRTLKINRAVVATEPKAHRIYIEECIKQGIPVLTDKPITAPIGAVTSLDSASKIYQDVLDLKRLLDANEDARVLVQCQRRNHGGYDQVFKTVSSLVKEYGIPITFLSIHHSDGMWNMPDEFFYRENHPYKYGYGKLLHSGYHFIDLLVGLLRLNQQLTNKNADTVNIFSQYSRVADQLSVINHDNYQNFFGKKFADHFKTLDIDLAQEEFGEVDSYSQLQLTERGKIITTAQISLMQSGFSQRGWPTLPEDTYKSNGRVRHEHINIHIGPLASIQVHSYQSKQINDQSLNTFDAGGNNHFDIYIFRNSNLIGGNAFEKIQYGYEDLALNKSNTYLGHNEYARYQTIDELIYGRVSKSELESHLATNELLSEIYKNHARQSMGEIPVSSMPLSDLCL